MTNEVKDKLKVSPFLVMFLITSMQVGVGVLGFQANIVKSAGNDVWLVVIFSGILVHIMLFVLYIILNKSEGDLVSLHTLTFGKWIGNMLSFLWLLYFIFISITVLRGFIEVVQVWMFAKIGVFWFSVVFLLMVYYTVTGGFRVVTGISFLGTLIPAYLVFTLFYPVQYADFRNILPIFNHSIKDFGMATKDMTLSYLGYSTLLLYYPLIKNAKKSQKWAHIGNLMTLVLYLIIVLISTAYFNVNLLEKQVWATLSLWKIVKLPFVERMEYIGITSWALVILPNLCLTLWAASKGIEKITKVKQKKALVVILLFVLLCIFFIKDREQIEKLNQWTSVIGLYLEFVYIPIFAMIYLIVRLIRKRRKKK